MGVGLAVWSTPDPQDRVRVGRGEDGADGVRIRPGCAILATVLSLNTVRVPVTLSIDRRRSRPPLQCGRRPIAIDAGETWGT